MKVENKICTINSNNLNFSKIRSVAPEKNEKET